MFEAVESRFVTVLIALDLSAAFDIIDYPVIVKKLEHTFGNNWAVLSWLTSYLNGISCFIKSRDASSTTTMNETGIPQGSCLGLLLFQCSLYVER